tara:strand:- start:3701 stop:3967 length:267 start_codon:yes stop_codon:yes gene_type:complete
MSAPKPDATALMRQRRAQFDYAIANKCSMAEAKKRLAAADWQATVAQQQAKARTVLCGTPSPRLDAPRFRCFIDASQPPERDGEEDAR